MATQQTRRQGEGVFSFRWDILYVSISSLEGVPEWALRQSSWMSEKLSKDAFITKSYIIIIIIYKYYVIVKQHNNI